MFYPIYPIEEQLCAVLTILVLRGGAFGAAADEPFLVNNNAFLRAAAAAALSASMSSRIWITLLGITTRKQDSGCKTQQGVARRSHASLNAE